MSENQRVILIIVIGVLIMVGFTVYSNQVSWEKEKERQALEKKLAVGIKGNLKVDLQAALDKYIEKYNDRPAVFSDFVTFADNKPAKSTIDLNKYLKNLDTENPVKGLDSKTLVVRIKESKENKEETVAYLLNNSFITLANI